jgi:chemotaxis protein MotA
MFTIIGSCIVLVCVVGGYLLERGNLAVLFQPVQLLIIGGAAVGGFIIANPPKVIRLVLGAFGKMLRASTVTKEEYIEVLSLLIGMFNKIRQQGLVSIESDVDRPQESKLFRMYPKVVNNSRAINLITDTLRTIMSTTIPQRELEALIDSELEAHEHELLIPSKAINAVAHSLPGLGIVAAAMGVVLAMGKLSEPPEVLGMGVGAALVGIFLGVLLCYGFVGPMGRSCEHLAADELEYLNVLKVSLLAFIGGAAPKVAVEFGRRVIPAHVKPTFLELEEVFRKGKK